MDEIVFSAKYGDWISVKKMSIDEKTAKPEVVAMLASIRENIDRKAFQFSGVDIAKIDAKVAEITKGRRKAYGTLAEVVSSLNWSELKQVFAASVPEERAVPLAEAYFFKSLLTALGFNFEVSVGLLTKIYPEIKMPKPMGRMPGAKKKS